MLEKPEPYPQNSKKTKIKEMTTAFRGFSGTKKKKKKKKKNGKKSKHRVADLIYRFPKKLVIWPGGHLYFRLDIILIKGLSKHTLNTYFSGMKIYPKYAFLYKTNFSWDKFWYIRLMFFSICRFQNLSIWPKTHPFYSIFHVFAPLIYFVRVYIAWSCVTCPWI